MAEIKIEKKKSIWPWILLGLIGLGLVWYFFMRDDNNRIEKEPIVSEQVAEEYDDADRYSATTVYSAYIADTDRMGVDHEYSKGALNHLIDAVKEKADMFNVDVKADLDEARRKASEITEDPDKLNHADLIKSSGEIIVRALTTLKEASFPTLTADVKKVSTAVNEIDTSVKTLDQKDRVNNFFKSAESLLLKMQ
ncbi:MAG: hypothetical protein GX921_10510 [Bacteroidales bacterium]|nr:hypothetical protein [Bacteroidales bacterium]